MKRKTEILMQSGILVMAMEGISGVDAAMLLACLALAAATLIFILYIEPDAADSAPHRSRLDQMLERRDTIYENLRDLKFEHRTGKYSEQDYEEMKEALESEAAVVLAQMEELTGGHRRPARRDLPGAAVRPAAREKLPS